MPATDHCDVMVRPSPTEWPRWAASLIGWPTQQADWLGRAHKGKKCVIWQILSPLQLTYLLHDTNRPVDVWVEGAGSSGSGAYSSTGTTGMRWREQDSEGAHVNSGLVRKMRKTNAAAFWCQVMEQYQIRYFSRTCATIQQATRAPRTSPMFAPNPHANDSRPAGGRLRC